MKKNVVIPALVLCAGLSMAACAKKDSAEAEEATEVVLTEAEAPEETVNAEPVQTDIPAMEGVVEEAPVYEEPAESAAQEVPAEEGAVTAEVSENAPVQDFTVEETGETTVYTTDTVNMRKGPSSSDFEVVGKLSKGASITSNGKVNGYKGDGKVWYRIKRTDGSEDAFIIADYISTEKPAETAEKTAEEAKKADTAAKAAADDAAAKAEADAAAKALADAAAKAAADQAAAAQAATPAAAETAAAAVPATSPDAKIAADWNRTGAISRGLTWDQLDEGTKAALRIHYEGHGTAGW
ncbi:MAG: SH3 domain-containing protein [Lachnospiraceae bacterium]|nr:SH3 domain-containing protein [Lachnospiraceae bacterium]